MDALTSAKCTVLTTVFAVLAYQTAPRVFSKAVVVRNYKLLDYVTNLEGFMRSRFIAVVWISRLSFCLVLVLLQQVCFAQTTFLVNIDTGNSLVIPAVAADFAVADPGIDLSAPVNEVNQTTNNLPGSNGGSINFSIASSGGIFVPTDGNFFDQPILDCYFFQRSSTEFRTIQISSIEEYSPGANIRVTLYGVGDDTQQETQFQLTYNGSPLGIQETDYDSAVLADAVVSYQFTKVAGVDDFEIGFRDAGNGGGTGGFNGFSITEVISEGVRINVGGSQQVDSQGNVFMADQYFNGGTRVFTTDQDIFIVGSGTNASNDQDIDDILYQSERFDNELVYSIPIDDGIYNVRLHFAEIFFGAPNRRVFDVEIEGQTVLDDFDIFGARMNAFTPGNFASLVQEFNEVEFNDGFATIVCESNGDDGINNAKLSAIEIIRVGVSTLTLLPSGGGTVVSESGGTDAIEVVLTQPPTANVIVTVQPGDQIAAAPVTLIFTAEDFDIPQSVLLSAVQDNIAEGTQSVQVGFSANSIDPNYDGISRVAAVTVFDDDVVEVDFDNRTFASLNNPTAGTFGPDGRLYVATQSADIFAYTFDDNYNVTNTEFIDTIADLSDSGTILGIAFNPFEEVAPGETATLFVGRTFLNRATTDYESTVVTLSGPNHSVLTEIITGLPVSGFDHGLNGIQFDGEGNMLMAIGGNTNTGIFDGVFGSDAPESPLTSAILRARVSDPNFNGNVVYEFIDPNDSDLLDLIDDLNISADPNNQLLGEFVQVVDVPGEVEMETFAVGLRNSYDLVWTTMGLVYATDNGPNGIAMDELNLVGEGDFLGHPSIPRGRLDSRQVLSNAEYDPNVPSTAIYTAPLAAVQSSTDGIDEYRSQTFNSQLKGQLIAQRFNGQTFFFQLNEDGTQLLNTNQMSGVADGLDILTGPGGVIFGIDRNQDRITIAEPVDDAISQATAYDIFPFRAPASGGNQFVIGGKNFGSLFDTTVLIDDVDAELISVGTNRIVGIFPAIANVSPTLRDVIVSSNGDVSVLTESFMPLGSVFLGDINRDGVVDLVDIAPFVDLILNGLFQAEADLNQDGVVDLVDIAPFVDLILNG